MKPRVGLFCICLAFLVFAVSANGQGLRISQPNFVGGHFVATHLDGLGGSSAAGPGLELFLKYNLSPRIFLSAGTGVYTITDETLRMENYRSTLLPTVDLRAGYNLVENGASFMPFLFVGLHGFGSKSTVKLPTGTYTGETYYDGGVLGGGGLSYKFNHQWAFQVMGDYRYILTADADPKPKYWVAKAGLTYDLGARDVSGREEMEYPLDEGELSLDDLFREEDLQESSEDEKDALALLFQPEEEAGTTVEEQPSVETTKYADTEVGQLMTRIHELRDEMDRRLQQVEDLQNQVRANEKAIAEVTGRVAGDYTGYASGAFGVKSPESFKANYEMGLQKFYAKQYQDAIRAFSGLLASNPDHRLASNCQYWIGESYNALGDYRKAIEAFNAVMGYRSSYKFDDALLMSGLCHMKLGNRITARDNFQELISRFPDSEYAPKAMRYLGRL